MQGFAKTSDNSIKLLVQCEQFHIKLSVLPCNSQVDPPTPCKTAQRLSYKKFFTTAATLCDKYLEIYLSLCDK